jgi:hypothetical protein
MVNALYMDDWTVSGHEMTEDTLTIEASYDIPPSNCPKCGVVPHALVEGAARGVHEREGYKRRRIVRHLGRRPCQDGA